MAEIKEKTTTTKEISFKGVRLQGHVSCVVFRSLKKFNMFRVRNFFILCGFTRPKVSVYRGKGVRLQDVRCPFTGAKVSVYGESRVPVFVPLSVSRKITGMGEKFYSDKWPFTW